jgi:hypothetical protein
MLMPSIAGEQPKLCRSAHGDPSNRSLRSNGRLSDGSASPPPDFAPFWSYSCDGMRRECMCVCAAVQVAPTLRIPPRKPCDLSGASLTPRPRRLHAVSTWRGSRNGTSLPCAQSYPSNLSHSDGSAEPTATRAPSGLCRPIWVSLRACQLHIPCEMHTGCTRPAGSSRLASGKAAAGGVCACVALVIVRSDRGHRPERLLLAACSSYLGMSCISADPRAPGVPWATAEATVESHAARLCKFARPMCSVHIRLGEGMPCDSCS